MPTAYSRYCLAMLGVLWVGAQGACWCYYRGPHLMGDGKGYLVYAQHLAATGTFGGGHYRLYAGYSAFIALFLKLGLGLRAVALAQVVLSGLAAWAFYHTALQLAGQYWPSAVLATATWISWVSVQAFNPFILTESVFTSCLVLCLWALVRLRRGGGGALLLVLLLYTATVRPNGFVACAAAGAAGLGSCWLRGQRSWAVVGLLAGLLLMLLAIDQGIKPFNIVAGYVAGTVLFDYEPSRIKPPATLVLPAASDWPIMQLVSFVAHNFRYASQVCAAKIGYFLGYPRPWYSLAHRLWSFMVLPPVYLLAVLGATRRRVAMPVRLYLAAAILLQLGIIMLVTEEWDSRFSAPFVAYWLQLAAIGTQPVLKRWLPIS